MSFDAITSLRAQNKPLDETAIADHGRPRPRSEAELANVVDLIASLWLGLSQREIARKLDLKAGVISGLVGRARRRGDQRFPSRPDPSPKVKPPKVRRIKPVDEAVGNARPLAPPRPQLLVALGPRDCKWPLAAATDGRHLFCGLPQAAGSPYCARHAARTGAAGTGAKFVLRARRR